MFTFAVPAGRHLANRNSVRNIIIKDSTKSLVLSLVEMSLVVEASLIASR
jgi:hypothetical protein